MLKRYVILFGDPFLAKYGLKKAYNHQYVQNLGIPKFLPIIPFEKYIESLLT